MAPQIGESRRLLDSQSPGEIDHYIEHISALSASNSASLYKQLLTTLIISLGPLSMGLVIGFSSPTIPDLQEKDLLENKDQVTWYGSIITLGAMAGSLLAGVAVGVFGRKPVLLFLNLPMSVGWFLIVYAEGHILLYCGRLLTGFAIGITSLVAPLYLSEVVTKELRGTLGSIFQLAITIGIVGSFSLGIPLQWRWLANTCAVLPVLMVVSVVLLPESPRWLVSKGYESVAQESLHWLRGRDYDVEGECMEIEENIASQCGQSFSLHDLRKSAILKPLLISVGLMLFQQGSGINAVIFYSNTIFQTAGFGENSNIPTVITGTMPLVGTVVSCLLMDRAGRRFLLMLSGIFMFLSCISFGLYYYLTNVKHIHGLAWLSLASIVVYVIAFSLGWGPIPWLVMSEILPIRVRGFGCGISSMFNWAACFVVTKEFHVLQEAVHSYGAFWIFAGVILLGIIFVAVLLPETKGRSLEEIEDYFAGSNSRSS